MTYAIVRVIGNELPPRDEVGAKLRSLRHILQHSMDHNAVPLWVINHLHDDRYRQDVVDCLKNHGQPFVELEFDRRTYCSLKSNSDRLCYALNVNAARNVAIRLGQQHSDFTACLDQECYFTSDLWAEVTTAIELDQGRAPSRKYYGLLMKRLTCYPAADWAALPNEEPQVIFRRDADQLFDVNIPFGQNDKVELLRRLGYRVPRYEITGTLCKTAGEVLHLCCGSTDLERNLNARLRTRRESLERLLRHLDRRCGLLSQ